MKRSERIFEAARGQFLFSVLLFVVAVASGVWAAGAILSESAVSAWALAAMALVALTFSAVSMAEALRLLRLSGRERRWEDEAAIRPRL